MEKLDSVSSLKDGRLFTVPQFHTFTLTGCSHCSVFTLPCSTLIFLEYTATSHVRVELVCICCKMANISKMIPWIIHDGYCPYHGKPIDYFFPLETSPLSVLLVIRRFFGGFPVLRIIIRYKELRTHRWSQLISEKGDKIYFKVILFFFFIYITAATISYQWYIVVVVGLTIWKLGPVFHQSDQRLACKYNGCHLFKWCSSLQRTCIFAFSLSSNQIQRF